MFVGNCIFTFTPISVDSLKAFAEQYLAGELEVYVKSEPVPEDNDGPVKVSCVCYSVNNADASGNVCRWW